MTFGYTHSTDTCRHTGTWETTSVAGYGVQYCTGCGASFFLWEKNSDGTLVWMPMHRLNDEEAQDVVDLEQEMRPVQAEETERSVLPESDEERRERPPLQIVSQCAEPEPGTSEGEAVL